MSVNGGFGGEMGLQMVSGIFNSIAQTQQQMAAYNNQMAQIEMAKRQADDEYRQRVAAAILTMQQADLAQQQAVDATAASKSEIAREMLRAREAAKAAASAGGVAGNTLNRIVGDISFTEQQKLAVEDSNKENFLSTQQAQKQNAIESTKMAPLYYTEPAAPNIFNSMFSVIPALFGGFGFGGQGGGGSCGVASHSPACSGQSASHSSWIRSTSNPNRWYYRGGK